MEWFIANWDVLVQALVAVLAAGSIIAKLTPTKWDDKWIGKIINLVGLAKK